jgi:hypothetical protein
VTRSLIRLRAYFLVAPHRTQHDNRRQGYQDRQFAFQFLGSHFMNCKKAMQRNVRIAYCGYRPHHDNRIKRPEVICHHPYLCPITDRARIMPHNAAESPDQKRWKTLVKRDLPLVGRPIRA